MKEWDCEYDEARTGAGDGAVRAGAECGMRIPGAGAGNNHDTEPPGGLSQAKEDSAPEVPDCPLQNRMAEHSAGLAGTVEHADEAKPPTPEETLNALFSEVYQELRGMARGMLRTLPPNRTLQPTVLVHEAYLRLCHTYHTEGVNRRYFFGAASEAMRRIMVEDARRRMTLRRGGHWARIPLDQLQVAADADPELLLGIDEALEKLSAQCPLKAQVVKLMFFGGLTAAETGEALELCDRTVKRHWAFARAWLYHELSPPCN